MESESYRGKVALVTGSNRGIGLAAAREMAKHGMTVVLNGRTRERLQKARQALSDEGYRVMDVVADVTNPESCRGMIEQVLDAFGRIDVLVNSAGISMRANLEEVDHKVCRQVVDLNLLGSIYPTLYAIPHLKQSQGSIVYISSIAGLIGLPTASLYCATKTALRGLADSLRCELAPHGVHVGVVYVGFTQNDPEKRVLGAGGKEITPDRPTHMTWEQVAAEIWELVKKRRRQVVLSPIGKLARFIAWFSPRLVEASIIFSRKHQLSERLGLR